MKDDKKKIIEDAVNTEEHTNFLLYRENDLLQIVNETR